MAARAALEGGAAAQRRRRRREDAVGDRRALQQDADAKRLESVRATLVAETSASTARRKPRC